MIDIPAATLTAIHLLLTGDAVLWIIIFTSMKVSLIAIIITTPFAILLAFVLAHTHFTGRRALISLFNVFLAFPAVVVGLLVYMLLSRSGPLGELHLLFTQTAMVIGQIALCLPVLVAMGHSALQAADRRAWETAITLGASPFHAMLTVMREVRFGLIAAIIAGFSRIISEVGCSMIVGGNILNHTRNIPTAIALETSKGEFVQGIALGLVLLLLALLLYAILVALQGKGEMQT